MPLKLKTKPASSRLLEEPKIVLAAPGSITPRHRLTQVLAAGSLLAVAFRPYPGPVARPLASTFTVINLSPSGPGSLRQAIVAANAHPGPDIVIFQAGLTGTIPITTQISISDSVQIVGPGPGLLSVSGSHTARIFYLGASSVFTTSISGLTLRDGNSSANGGGAIYDSAQPLTLDQVNFISNTTLGRGGAVFVEDSTVDPAFTLRNSLVTGNHADDQGGGVALYDLAGAVQITNTQFMTNSTSRQAGGLFLYQVHGPITIDASTFVSNSAVMRGGAIDFYRTDSATLQNTTISGNSAVQGGGLSFYKSGAATIQGSSISGNTATIQSGGGVFLYNPSGLVTIQDSTIRDNNVILSGGGGLALKSINVGQVAIRRTTISGNSAQQGGGLLLRNISSPVLLEDSTVSGNGTKIGGGLYFNYVALDNIAIQNSSIVSNTAANTAGGVHLGPAVLGTLALTNTIVADNSAINAPDLSNTVGAFRLSYDLVQVTGTATISDAGGNLFGLDPLLGPLANNGGPTQTHVPLHGSPAVDAGDPAFAPPPSADQRGRPRVSNGRIDIGAVEVNTGAVQFTSSTFQVAENALTATVTLTRTGGSDGVASVQFATGGGTATAGSDYIAASGTVNWASGDMTPKSFPVTILNDHLAEANETIGLTLSNAHGAALGSPSSALLTIIDGSTKLFLPLLRR